MAGIVNGIQNLWNGILTIVNAIKMFIQFGINLIKSLIQLIELLATTVSNTFTLITTLPPWLIAVATATLSIAVLYIVVGRESGK